MFVAAGLTIPLMLVAGGLGVLAASIGVVEVPALSAFALTAELPTVMVAAVALLANGITTVVVSLLGRRRVDLERLEPAVRHLSLVGGTVEDDR